ncbi:MAG: GAF domain-containing protein [Candidatus Rokuibacteriota bacterium]
MNTTSTIASEAGFTIDPDVRGFPFKRELSLAPLVDFWCDAVSDDHSVSVALAKVLEEEVDRAPELLEPIEDLSVIAKHQELVHVLMSKAFPAASWEQDYAAAMTPFHLRAFYATPSFERLLLGDDGLIRGRVNLDERTVATVRILHAYDLILRKYYDIELGFDYPIIVTVTDPASGLDRHFRMQFDRRFLEVQTVSDVPPLTSDQRRRLLANLGDPDVLMELVPPASFVFRGFAILKALDVTDQEVLSSLKRDLIEKDSIVSNARFQSLQHKLCTLLRRPDLRLGLAAVQDDQVFMLNDGQRIEHSCIFADSIHHNVKDFAGSIYDRAIAQGHPLIVEDLTALPDRTAIEEALIRAGLRSLLVAPLYYQDALIGALELASPHPGDLGSMSVLTLRDVLPLFSMAVRRTIDDLNARIQAVIKEKCTNIHPSVEWRFRQAVLRGIGRRGEGAGAEMEPIVFKHVYPLYGVSDIRGSAAQRNLAIQADLITHLSLAREVVALAREARPLPIVDELAYRLGKRLGQIEGGLSSGDEVGIIAFLREHVEPLFDHMAGFAPGVRERIQAYRAALDPRLGTIYRRRKDYEDSVTLIGETISAYLDAEEEMAQAMFPHYFEKQRTDGVDHSIYIGAALVENGVFDELYVRNLRLWQLMVMCGIARRTDALRSRLRVPLETTHLVLVQHTPLSIRFRFDEKRFDVDGAYNVRYEVIKKRIDKALIRGTTERATQPGTIAIVYSQPREAREYREYLDYLAASGYLTGITEELELEELQGVQGLKALRVTVDLTARGPEARPVLREAAETVRALAR